MKHPPKSNDAPRGEDDLIGTIWRHKVRGFTYEIISDTAGLQCSSVKELEERFEGEHWIVYRSQTTGHVWIRPRPEFLDGRFERVIAEAAIS